MFARVSRYSGSTDGLRAGFEAVTPELEQEEGFVQAFFLVDEEHSRAVSITLWDSRETLDGSSERAHAMRTRATEPSDATVDSVESYQVALTAEGTARAG
jgi:heme-degrading monooxygenase HmoA